jgi:predicted DNA binding CopG/RHH family protein
MKAEYDFSNGTKNPYVKALKKQITIRIGGDTVEYFKELSGETGIPYQTLMDMFLTDCANKKMKPEIKWNK